MKELLKRIKEIKEKKNGKAILFFAFYLIFFTILILVIRFSEKRPLPSASEYEKGTSYTFYLDKIANNNYHYIYTITLDGVKYVYDGNKYNDKEMFKFNAIDYFKSGDDFFKNTGIWVKSESPYIYDDFFDLNNISEIVELATYDSKTSFDNGRLRYNFLISTNTLNQMLNNVDSDYLEEPNELVIDTQKDKFVDEITFNLNSYCTMNKLCQNSLEIKLSYDKFGEIEEISNPF